LIPLREYFGSRKLRPITYGDLQKYKARRLKTPVIVGCNISKQRDDSIDTSITMNTPQLS